LRGHPILIQADYLGHSGGIAGFRAVLNYSPEFDMVVVIHYNNDAAGPEQFRGGQHRCFAYKGVRR